MGREVPQQSYCDPTGGAKGCMQRLEVEADGALLLNGCKVSVMRDEDVWVKKQRYYLANKVHYQSYGFQ